MLNEEYSSCSSSAEDYGVLFELRKRGRRRKHKGWKKEKLRERKTGREYRKVTSQTVLYA